MSDENNNIFEGYTTPSYINREPAPNPEVETPPVETPLWFTTEEGRENTYTSEDMHNYNTQQMRNKKAQLDALRRFLNEAVSNVDLPTLTIPMDDKGEQ